MALSREDKDNITKIGVALIALDGSVTMTDEAHNAVYKWHTEAFKGLQEKRSLETEANIDSRILENLNRINGDTILDEE